VALDRQSIEKKDFPIGRRGYEPEAVDAHLAALAGEVDTLRRSRQSGGESLASAASEQVRAIVQAAESSAAEIEVKAQDEATRIRREAQDDAAKTRDEAVARAEAHVGKVGESTALMLQRIDAMESELGALIESLRTGANRLTADLTLLQGNMGELYDAAGGPPPAATPEPAPVAAVPEPEPAEEPVPEPSQAVQADAPEPEAAPVEPTVPDVAPVAEPAADGAPAASDDGDVEGARLVALNMALNGSPREETDAYLRDNFDLGDREGLLDEVYATVG
jgi:hypothetical protein